MEALKSKNIIDRIHTLMNQSFKETNGNRPVFLYLGDNELNLLELSEGLFCPVEYKETPLFGMEIVAVKRESFMEVGC